MTETRAPRGCLVGPEPTVCEVLKATPGLPDLRAVTAAWGRLARWVQLGRPAPWWRERRCRDLPGLTGLTGPRECRETLEPRERWGPGETKDPEEWRGKMVCRVRPALRGRRAEWEMWGSPGCRVRREMSGRLVSWVPPAYRELPASPVSRASKAFLACLGTPGRPGGKETPGRLGLTGRTEWMGSLG